jgi:hypothetical protein
VVTYDFLHFTYSGPRFIISETWVSKIFAWRAHWELTPMEAILELMEGKQYLQNVILEAGSPAKSLWNLISLKKRGRVRAYRN